MVAPAKKNLILAACGSPRFFHALQHGSVDVFGLTDHYSIAKSFIDLLIGSLGAGGSQAAVMSQPSNPRTHILETVVGQKTGHAMFHDFGNSPDAAGHDGHSIRHGEQNR